MDSHVHVTASSFRQSELSRASAFPMELPVSAQPPLSFEITVREWNAASCAFYSKHADVRLLAANAASVTAMLQTAASALSQSTAVQDVLLTLSNDDALWLYSGLVDASLCVEPCRGMLALSLQRAGASCADTALWSHRLACALLATSNATCCMEALELLSQAAERLTSFHDEMRPATVAVFLARARALHALGRQDDALDEVLRVIEYQKSVTEYDPTTGDVLGALARRVCAHVLLTGSSATAAAHKNLLQALSMLRHSLGSCHPLTAVVCIELAHTLLSWSIHPDAASTMLEEALAHAPTLCASGFASLVPFSTFISAASTLERQGYLQASLRLFRTLVHLQHGAGMAAMVTDPATSAFAHGITSPTSASGYSLLNFDGDMCTDDIQCISVELGACVTPLAPRALSLHMDRLCNCTPHDSADDIAEASEHRPSSAIGLIMSEASVHMGLHGIAAALPLYTEALAIHELATGHHLPASVAQVPVTSIDTQCSSAATNSIFSSLHDSENVHVMTAFAMAAAAEVHLARSHTVSADVVELQRGALDLMSACDVTGVATLPMLLALCRSLEKLSKFAQADVMYQRGIAIVLKHCKSSVRYINELYKGRARALQALCCPSDAIACLLEQAGLLEAIGGEHIAAAHDARFEAACLLQSSGQHARAHALHLLVLRHRMATCSGPDSCPARCLAASTSSQHVAACLAAAGQHADAATCYITASTLTPELPSLVIHCLLAAANCLLTARKPADALEVLDRALPLARDAELVGSVPVIATNAGNLEVSYIFEQMALCHRALRQFDAALGAQLDAVDAAVAAHGKRSMQLAHCFRNLADCYMSMDQPEDAVDVLHAAADIFNHADMREDEASTLLALCDVLQRIGEARSALPIRARVHAIFRVVHGQSHPITMKYAEELYALIGANTRCCGLL